MRLDDDAEAHRRERVTDQAADRGAATTPFGTRIGRLSPGCEADIVLFDWDAVTFPYQNADVPPVDVLVQRAKSSSVRSVLVAGEEIYRDGRFLRVDRDATMAEIAARFAQPLSAAETERRQLGRDIFPHVRAFYDGWLAELGDDPFYRGSGRF
jgi:cytosine/adenosine deaminase-related metal-dependent hydrolase